MIAKLVAAAVRAPLAVFVLALALLGVGLRSYVLLDIEAYPNPVAPMIEIIAQPQGWSAEEVERYVSVPLETGLVGMPGLEHIRSQSLFGLADVKCYFGWDTSYFTAQQRVLNQLGFIALPPGVTPGLSPWSAIGELFRYKVVGKGYTLVDLKTAQDWILEKQFRQVPGVIDVVGFGGLTKQYHVEVDPYRLRGRGVALSQLQSAIANANQNVGGQRITLGEQSFDVRGIGLIRSVQDIGDITVGAAKGVPVRVSDVANVSVGAAPRLGIVGQDDEPDVVEGIVLMRYGGDSLKTIQGIHERVDYIRQNRVLPPGIDIEPVYDRADLVKLTTHTVMENLLIGMILVSLVLWLFLGSARAALITAINLPLALMVALTGMVASGTAANLISLGAVDFGIVVDSTVIMMETIFRNLARKGGTVFDRIVAAAREVGPPMFSSALIIAVAFIPLFTLTGVAGVIMSPMAQTYAFAIGGSILLSLTLTPTLASRFLPVGSEGHEEEQSWPMQVVAHLYAPLFSLSLRKPKLAVLLGTAPVVLALVASTFLGREFMPKLEEGNFWIRATLPMSISLEKAARMVGRMRAIVRGCPSEEGATCEKGHERRPEIQTAISQLGRPDDGTDVSGFYNIELLAPLKPSSEWRRGVTKESMTAEMQKELGEAFPGVVFSFSQAISDNVEEAMSGVKGENTVKVVGPDLHVNESKAEDIVEVLKKVPGVEDLGIFRSLGQPAIRITPYRGQIGRYGLNTGDVAAVVQAAIGGQVITQVFEGEKHFDLILRWAEQYRRDVRSIRNILVSAADGSQVPLGQIAEVVEEEGPSVIFREDLKRYVPVKFSVRGRDLASTIGEAQARIAPIVKQLPYDTHLEWAGEMNQLRETTNRLLVIVPITLLIIAFLVFNSTKNGRDMLIVLLGVPVACSGGIVALYLTRTDFSISAAMGFISILGVAVQDALLVVTYARRLREEGATAEESARQAAERWLRPVLMATCVAMLGLLPAALSHGIGSETQKPLAIVVIGGALALAILPRLLQPALILLAHRHADKRPA